MAYTQFNEMCVKTKKQPGNYDRIMTFSKELSIGNRVLDVEHKKLLSTIKSIENPLAEKDIPNLLQAFEFLEICLGAYFKIEENVAQKVGFDFKQHKIAHQDLLRKVQRIRDELVSKNGMWSRDEGKSCIDLLSRYLTLHIAIDSRPLKTVLETHFYDF